MNNNDIDNLISRLDNMPEVYPGERPILLDVKDVFSLISDRQKAIDLLRRVAPFVYGKRIEQKINFFLKELEGDE